MPPTSDRPAPVTQPAVATPAGLLVRLASLFYEAVLLVAILFVSAWLFVSITHYPRFPGLRPLFQAYLAGISALWFGWCWSNGGQTPAMKAWRLRVVGQFGAPVRPGQAAMRFLLAAVLIPAGGIALLWALVDPDGQFLHDRLAGTRVVRLPRPSKGVPTGRRDAGDGAPGPHGTVARSGG